MSQVRNFQRGNVMRWFLRTWLWGKGGRKKKVRMTSHQIWKHSPIFPSLIFYLVNFSQILYSLLHFSAYPEGIWILFWPWSAKIMHSHLEFHTNKSIPPTQGWNKQFFWYTKLEEIYHLKEGKLFSIEIWKCLKEWWRLLRVNVEVDESILTVKNTVAGLPWNLNAKA